MLVSIACCLKFISYSLTTYVLCSADNQLLELHEYHKYTAGIIDVSSFPLIIDFLDSVHDAGISHILVLTIPEV